MVTLKSNIKQATAFAPATVANVAVGFDLLGFSFPAVGDYVTLARRSDNMLTLTIESDDTLTTDIEKNVATATIMHVLTQLNLQIGFDVTLKKGIPIGSGMGGSAASTAAALVALNAFLEPTLTTQQLAQFALYGEKIATGAAHPDNVVPCIYGGLTLTTKTNPLTVITLPLPNLFAAVVHPNIRIDTRDSRQRLTEPFPITTIVQQTANLAGFIASCYRQDKQLMQQCLNDVLVEPRRAPLIPNFNNIKTIAKENDAIGVSISGSGPSIFALTTNQPQADKIARLMCQQFTEHAIDASYYTHQLTDDSAHLVAIYE